MTRIYTVDGQGTGASALATEARQYGLPPRLIYSRLHAGDRTRERLFRPVGNSGSHKAARDAAEVAEAIRNLDSRPRNWTGY